MQKHLEKAKEIVMKRPKLSIVLGCVLLVFILSFFAR